MAPNLGYNKASYRSYYPTQNVRKRNKIRLIILYNGTSAQNTIIPKELFEDQKVEIFLNEIMKIQLIGSHLPAQDIC